MKYLMILFWCLLSCTTDSSDSTEPATIMGAYVYANESIHDTYIFLEDGTFNRIFESVLSETQYYHGPWKLTADTLCIYETCSAVRNITEEGFEWFGFKSWDYWKKL